MLQQISNHLVTGQQSYAFSNMYMVYVQDLLKFEMSIRMRKEDDISDSDCGMEEECPKIVKQKIGKHCLFESRFLLMAQS